MMDKVRSKPTLPRSKKTVEPTGAMIMLMMPGAVLKGIELPAGAQVAIVSNKLETVKRIRHQFKGKHIIWRIREIHAEASSPNSKARYRAAFEPDARSLAILEGVRTAQEDLREAGGAYDLDQVRTLMRGVSRQAIDKRVKAVSWPCLARAIGAAIQPYSSIWTGR
jgi:hypothetical protein